MNKLHEQKTAFLSARKKRKVLTFRFRVDSHNEKASPYFNHCSTVQDMVEVRGIEPLSEDSGLWFSPSAAMILNFPLPHASWRAYGVGSFIVPASGKAY